MTTRYQATALAFQLHYQAIAQPDLNNSYLCAFPSYCLDSPLLVSRRELGCFGMRHCSANVSIGALEIALWQASQSVRIFKRRLHEHREAFANDYYDSDVDDDDEDEDDQYQQSIRSCNRKSGEAQEAVPGAEDNAEMLESALHGSDDCLSVDSFPARFYEKSYTKPLADSGDFCKS